MSEDTDTIKTREILQNIHDLINDLHGSLDNLTYDEKFKNDFDAPDDHVYLVEVTAKQERDLSQAVVLIENLLKK